MPDAPDPQPLPTTTDDFPDSPRKAMLAACQVRQLADIATAGAHLGEQMVKQAEAANYVGVEGALMFARISRAVRQTIGMERSLGAHYENPSKRQMAKLFSLTVAGNALIQRLTQQNIAHNWLDGPGSLMMLRLTVATQRTMVLLRRIDGEFDLTPAERNALWKRRPRRRRAVPAKAAAPGAPQAAPVAAAPVPVPVPPDATLAQTFELLKGTLDDLQDEDKETREPKEALPGCDAGLADEDLTPVSVEDEIGDRSLAEIAAEACKVTGVVPTPELFAAADEAEASEVEASATETSAPPTSPGLSAAAELPTGRRGDDGVGVPGSDAGTPARSVPPPDSQHDPPSG